MKKFKDMDPVKLNLLKMITYSTISVLLIIFAVVILFFDSVVVNLILYTTCFSLFILGITRILTIFKGKGDSLKLKALINLIEALVNIIIAVAIIVIIPNPDASTLLVGVYCYLLSAVLFGRGLVFFIEGMYCDEDKKLRNFIIHFIFVVISTVFVAKDLTLDQLILIIFIISISLAAFGIFEVFLSFRRYKKACMNVREEEIREEAKSEVRQEMKNELNEVINEIVEEEVKEEKEEE